MKSKEIIREIAPIAITAGVIIYGSVFAFSSGSRRKIFERDKYRCVECGSPDNLDAAHYNHNRQRAGYDDPRNGRVLCVFDHLKDHQRNADHNGLSRKGNDWAIDKLQERARQASRGQ